MAQEPIVFINIGWMNDYSGLTPDDPIRGGHGFLKKEKFGHESWNFKPYRGKLFGYVPRSARINLSNLGGQKNDVSLSNITVAWIARNPRDRKTYVVGWYENATVYSINDAIKLDRAEGHKVGYQIEAPADKAVLLKADRRLFLVPTSKMKGNLGQSPVWYGGKDAFRGSVLNYIEAGGHFPKSPAKTQGAGKQNDPEARKRIELAAVRHATAFYQSVEGGEQTVVSVEKDGKGWDLTVTAPTGAVLKVEVKGLSGKELAVELTPNEYKQMRSPEHRTQYIIYVVSEAGASTEQSHVFLHNQEASKRNKLVWESLDGRRLKIEERVGARLSAPS